MEDPVKRQSHNSQRVIDIQANEVQTSKRSSLGDKVREGRFLPRMSIEVCPFWLVGLKLVSRGA